MHSICTLNHYFVEKEKIFACMPTNLHALIRYRTIDRCLQRTTLSWNWQSLAEACREAVLEQTGREVDAPSRRTILKDIAFMRGPEPGFNAPIVWDRSARSFRYSTKGFSIFQVPLTDRDLNELRQALALIRQYQGFDQLEHFEELLTRLEERLDMKSDGSGPVLHFEINSRATGLRWLNELYHHIRESKCLHIEYRPFNPDRHEHYVLSPYVLKEYNNRWFLIGHNHGERKTWTLALDRILSVSENDREQYYRDPGFDAGRWFRDIVGATVLENVSRQEVLIRVAPLQARYLETKPLHDSQRVIQRDPDFVDFAYTLRPNYELESALLALGEHVEVLKPPTLRDRLRRRLQRGLEKYD